jgi:predicted Zn-dependent peptidase
MLMKTSNLNKMKLEDVKNYYNELYGADNSMSAFVGELDKKQVTDFLQKSFLANGIVRLPYKTLSPVILM